MTQEEVEKIVGRPLKKMELLAFYLYKDIPTYTFGKDKFGNLFIQEKK